jgi:hypothetical protein
LHNAGDVGAGKRRKFCAGGIVGSGAAFVLKKEFHIEMAG